MKNTTLFFALFISFAAFAQFPRSKPELLIGREVKARPLYDYEININNGYPDFYDNERMSNVYMPNETNIRTKVDALKDRIFKVINVEATITQFGTNYKIILQNNDEVIYYAYRKKSKSYLEPVNFTLPDDYYCDFIEKSGDEPNFYYGTTKSTDYFQLYKYTYEGESDKYYLTTYVHIKGVAPASGTVTLVLDNGKKLSYPKIKFSFYAGKAYSSTINLSKADIQVLTESNIKEVYFDTWMVDLSSYSEELKGILKCLITKK